MKKLIYITTIVILFTACEKKEIIPAETTITEFELGEGNSKKATVGLDIHLNAKITAPAKIKSITVKIHSETDKDAWEFEKVYTDGVVGLLNTTFHRDLDVPSTAKAGQYHFDFIIVDQRGRSKEMEEDLTLEAATK